VSRISTPIDARQRARSTYNAASDFYDHPVNTFWEQYGRPPSRRRRRRSTAGSAAERRDIADPRASAGDAPCRRIVFRPALKMGIAVRGCQGRCGLLPVPRSGACALLAPSTRSDRLMRAEETLRSDRKCDCRSSADDRVGLTTRSGAICIAHGAPTGRFIDLARRAKPWMS